MGTVTALTNECKTQQTAQAGETGAVMTAAASEAAPAKSLSSSARKAIYANLGGASPASAEINPVTESILKKNGISYILLKIDPANRHHLIPVTDPNDPTVLAFPISQAAGAGEASDSKYTSSEAVSYLPLNALLTDPVDQTLFQQAMNAYSWLDQAKSEMAPNWAETPGLIGWLINLGTGDFSDSHRPYTPYDPLQPIDSGYTTASDADLNILEVMMQGIQKFGGTLPIQGNPPTTLQDLTVKALNTFCKDDIGHFTYVDKAGAAHDFDCILGNDSWAGSEGTGHANLNPGYANFKFLADLYAFAGGNSTWQGQLIDRAVHQMVQYLKLVQNDFGGELPDNPLWTNKTDGQPHSGEDAPRFLWNGLYLNPTVGDPFGIQDDLKGMMNSYISYVQNNSVDYGLPTMIVNKDKADTPATGAVILGPLYTAMVGLYGADSQQAQQILNSLNIALSIPEPSSSAEWQKNYFHVSVGLLSKGMAGLPAITACGLPPSDLPTDCYNNDWANNYYNSWTYSGRTEAKIVYSFDSSLPPDKQVYSPVIAQAAGLQLAIDNNDTDRFAALANYLSSQNPDGTLSFKSSLIDSNGLVLDMETPPSPANIASNLKLAAALIKGGWDFGNPKIAALGQKLAQSLKTLLKSDPFKFGFGDNPAEIDPNAFYVLQKVDGGDPFWYEILSTHIVHLESAISPTTGLFPDSLSHPSSSTQNGLGPVLLNFSRFLMLNQSQDDNWRSVKTEISSILTKAVTWLKGNGLDANGDSLCFGYAADGTPIDAQGNPDPGKHAGGANLTGPFLSAIYALQDPDLLAWAKENIEPTMNIFAGKGIVNPYSHDDKGLPAHQHNATAFNNAFYGLMSFDLIRGKAHPYPN